MNPMRRDLTFGNAASVLLTGMGVFLCGLLMLLLVPAAVALDWWEGRR